MNQDTGRTEPPAPAAASARRWFVQWWRLLAGLLVFGCLFAAYFRWYRARLPPDPRQPDDRTFALLLAAVVASFTFLTLTALAGVLQAALERRRLGAFAAGRVPRDGAFGAVEGRARATDGTLVAPFSQHRCLAYEYEVWIRNRPSVPGSGRRRRRATADAGSRQTHHVGLAGFAQAPTSIEGTHGRARLLGRPPLAPGFTGTWFDPGAQPEAAKRLDALRRDRQFERLTGWRGFRLVGRFLALQSRAPAATRQDLCFDAGALDAASHETLVRERVLMVAAAVGASGLWAASESGLHGEVGRAGLELWPGNLDDRRRTLLLQPIGRAAFMVVVTLALHAGVGLVTRTDTELAHEHRGRQAADFQRAWNAHDLEGVRAALAGGADPEQRDHYGDTLLMHASRARGIEWVQLLLDAGADVQATNAAYGRGHTALVAAALRGREDVVALLRASGAREFRVTADTGRPLPRDGGEPLRSVSAYYQAILDRDFAALERVRLDPFDDPSIDWDLWQRVRPFEAGVARGFWNDHAATLTLHAQDARGRPAVWAYHLVRMPPEPGRPDWRIAFEWSVD